MSAKKLPPPRMTIPAGTPIDSCVSCKRPIQFVRTAAGKSAPVDLDGTPHFATCPDAKKFSGKTRKEVLREQGELFEPKGQQ